MTAFKDLSFPGPLYIQKGLTVQTFENATTRPTVLNVKTCNSNLFSLLWFWLRLTSTRVWPQLCREHTGLNNSEEMRCIHTAQQRGNVQNSRIIVRFLLKQKIQWLCSAQRAKQRPTSVCGGVKAEKRPGLNDAGAENKLTCCGGCNPSVLPPQWEATARHQSQTTVGDPARLFWALTGSNRQSYIIYILEAKQ